MKNKLITQSVSLCACLCVVKKRKSTKKKGMHRQLYAGVFPNALFDVNKPECMTNILSVEGCVHCEDKSELMWKTDTHMKVASFH